LWIRGKKLKTPGVAFGYAERRRSQSFDKLRTSLSQMENNLSPREANCNGRRQSLGLLTEKTEHRRQETTNHKNRGGKASSKFKHNIILYLAHKPACGEIKNAKQTQY